MNELIEIIHGSSATGRPLGFDYEKDGVSERRQLVADPDEPVRVNASGKRYVIGEDIARGGPRSFHLDRMSAVSLA